MPRVSIGKSGDAEWHQRSQKTTKARQTRERVKVIIMGAAGRDFHNFNVFYRDKMNYEVVAFTASQIPGIEGRTYPRELAGSRYQKGIPIYSEEQLPELIRRNEIDEVVFAYSDVSHDYVMHKASSVLAAGPDFRLMGNSSTTLKSKKPVVSVCAVRTGSGKSQTSHRVCKILQDLGYRVVAVRHPMPYGDLKKQICQRFGVNSDLDRHQCTIEEREEYEAYLEDGMVVFAGVDYDRILLEAEKEADIIVWDGGNNDTPFYKSDLRVVVVDPHRPGHELKYHPGEANVRMADVVLINKLNTADPKDVETVEKNVTALNSKATIVKAASVITIDNRELVRDKKVLVVEDGPTVTHGGMPIGAGTIAARDYGAMGIVDPRPYATGSILEAYQKHPHMGAILPALGYDEVQMRELEKTVNAVECDSVIIGTPIDLREVLTLNKPAVRARYELRELGTPNLEQILSLRFPPK